MIERRRSETVHDPIGYIDAMPPRLLLDRLRFPVAAVLLDGTVVFVNAAFAVMLGHAAEWVAGRQVSDLLADAHTPRDAVALLRTRVGATIGLRHSDGSTVVALISNSVFLRDSDPLVLVGFADVTAYLWESGHLPDTTGR